MIDWLHRLVHGLYMIHGLHRLVDWLHRLVHGVGCLDGLQGLDDGHQRSGRLGTRGDGYGDGSGGIAEVIRMSWDIGGGQGGVQGAPHKTDTLATRRGRGYWIDIHCRVGIRTGMMRWTQKWRIGRWLRNYTGRAVACIGLNPVRSLANGGKSSYWDCRIAR